MIGRRRMALDHAQAERDAVLSRREEPRRVEIHLGTLCNNLCPFCMSGYSRDKKDPWASFERVRAELRHFREKGCRAVGFLGGEPTVYPRIVEAVACAKSLGYDLLTRLALLFLLGLKYQFIRGERFWPRLLRRIHLWLLSRWILSTRLTMSTAVRCWISLAIIFLRCITLFRTVIHLLRVFLSVALRSSFLRLKELSRAIRWRLFCPVWCFML